MAFVEDLTSSISSLASASSFEYISDNSHGHNLFSDESDDEIVYNVSEASDVEADEDFVLLRRAPERAHVMATPVGRPVDPKDIPLPIREDVEDVPQADEPEPTSGVDPSEDRSQTPSTVDRLASDLEGLSFTNEPAAPKEEITTPITIPDPVLSIANTPPTSVLRVSDHVPATSSTAKLPSLPDRSLLKEQIKVATAVLAVNKASVPPSQGGKKPKKPKKPKVALTEEQKEIKRQKKAKLKAKRARRKAKKLAKQAAETKAAAGGNPEPKKRLTRAERKAKKLAKTAKVEVAAAEAAKAAKVPLAPLSPPSPSLEDGNLRVKELSEAFSERISSAANTAPSSPISTNSEGSSMYEEASVYIDTFLSTPDAQGNSACRLTLIQALIIELGLFASPSSLLPTSIRAAKNYVKSNIFVNIGEYLGVRKQGPSALQKILYPSRKALIKDIRKKKGAFPVKKVKESGLQVLLVDCHLH